MIRAKQNSGAYYLGLSNLDDKGTVVTLKFDTGAINTIISLESVLSEKVDKKRFLSEMKSRTSQKVFRSASGNSMEGFLVCAENVLLSGMQIEKFYYYLIVELQESVALLGNDFISKCSFRHDFDGDIEIVGFNSDAYARAANKAITKKEVSELIEICSIENKSAIID